jgi:tetratricopeptide (TPR) repeat protein
MAEQRLGLCELEQRDRAGLWIVSLGYASPQHLQHRVIVPPCLFATGRRYKIAIVAAENPAQLIRIARLRRFVGVFARGGDRDSTAEALTKLSHASRNGGFTTDALRRARQAAQLLVEQETGEAGVRALLHLSSLCLETGASDAAASAAELARDRTADLTESNRGELFAGATLLAGIAYGIEGDVELARARLSEARDLLVAAGQPVGAALALVQQGLLDVAAEQPTAAEHCFSFARDFYRAAGVPIAAAETAAVAARAFASAGLWKHAERWFITAIGEADLLNATQLAAEMTVEHAAELERAEKPTEALRVASDGARRCARLATDETSAVLRATVRLQLARLVEDPREAIQHIEAVFELALPRRDVTVLGGALDVLVSGIVRDRFPPGSWKLVERFRDRLTGAAFDALAATAETALDELRK